MVLHFEEILMSSPRTDAKDIKNRDDTIVSLLILLIMLTCMHTSNRCFLSISILCGMSDANDAKHFYCSTAFPGPVTSNDRRGVPSPDFAPAAGH